jgi:methylmalonyl-CoA epimerase
MVLATHHVGIAVADLGAAVETYARLLQAEVEHRDRLEEQGVDAVSLRAGTGRIELLAPLGAETPVGRFLAKRGPGLHHIAFQVTDVGAELERLRRAGTRLIDETPRRGLFGLEVAFVHPESTGGVLAEFVSDGRT